MLPQMAKKKGPSPKTAAILVWNWHWDLSVFIGSPTLKTWMWNSRIRQSRSWVCQNLRRLLFVPSSFLPRFRRATSTCRWADGNNGCGPKLEYNKIFWYFRYGIHAVHCALSQTYRQSLTPSHKVDRSKLYIGSTKTIPTKKATKYWMVTACCFFIFWFYFIHHLEQFLVFSALSIAHGCSKSNLWFMGVKITGFCEPNKSAKVIIRFRRRAERCAPLCPCAWTQSCFAHQRVFFPVNFWI